MRSQAVPLTSSESLMWLATLRRDDRPRRIDGVIDYFGGSPADRAPLPAGTRWPGDREEASWG